MGTTPTRGLGGGGGLIAIRDGDGGGEGGVRDVRLHRAMAATIGGPRNHPNSSSTKNLLAFVFGHIPLGEALGGELTIPKSQFTSWTTLPIIIET